MKNETQKFADRSEPSFVSDLWHFLRSNKKYWLLPIVLVILLLGLLAILSSGAAAPFIYTLF
jgi:hypothetical protein